ncbi:serine hydrolase domain-containing protein [Erythrobacter sp. R86502]|uniref:serine hydrolase domain-containing protein n=1 Tax=Erythrobacter sp. R86502 TaxID=3093846 RepID=UPI0036D31ED0
MRTTTLAAAIAALALAVPLSAQSQQELLDARHDRALAAGYKALVLCSAIAIAERNGTTRTPESVEAWELTGIQAPLDGLVASLPFEIVRRPGGQIAHVAVDWAEDMPARIAAYQRPETGCSILPIGAHNGSDPHAQPAHEMALKILSPNDEPVLPEGRAGPKLAAAVERALDADDYGKGARTTRILIQSDGTTLADGYATDFGWSTPQRTFSVAKSIAATLIGASVYRGNADVNASAGLGLSEADPRRAITIDHLLRMASGRYSDTPGNRTDPLYYGGATVDEVALDWPLISPPGSTYRYANNDTLAAVAAIRKTFAAHPPTGMFAKLGMNHTVAETDWQGSYVLSSQVWSTADDLAAFGQLYLNDGVLPSGERVLPEGWVKYVTTPSGPQPATGTFGYGAGFWLLNKEEGVPPDTFAAIGNRGQYVVIVPSRQVVIVRRGEDPAGSSFNIAAFTRDVLASLLTE